MKRRVAALCTACAVVASSAFVAAATLARPVRIVDDARLERAASGAADGGAWLTYGGDREARRFSALRQIDVRNVPALRSAWTTQLSAPVSLEGTPLVDDGVMYATTGRDAVIALDARSGRKIWQYTYPLPDDINGLTCCNFNNRGVTLAGDLVVTETLDAHLVALERLTGRVRWDVTVADYQQGYSISSPPLYVDGMLVTGMSGGEYPTRGFIAAFDARTGAKRWQRFTVESETGGGSTWLQGTFDSVTDRLYWGVGNHNPPFEVARGDVSRRTTDSLLALDAKSGRIAWRYAYTPGNMWDYDGVNEPVLVDVRRGKRLVHAIAHADRNGYLYLLERADGRLLYAVPFVSRITWGTVNRTTGAVRLDPAMQAAAAAGKPIVFYPSTTGGKNWGPTATDPRKAVMYVAAIESGQRLNFAPATVVPQTFFENVKHALGALKRTLFPPRDPPVSLRLGASDDELPGQAAHGSVEAFDLASGHRLWRTPVRSPILGGLLATSGGLVFGGTPDGKLVAFDARDGHVVWAGRVPGGITAPPITYAVDGRQYISVEVGFGGVWPLFHLDATPWLRNVAPTSLVCTFALPATGLARAAPLPVNARIVR